MITTVVCRRQRGAVLCSKRTLEVYFETVQKCSLWVTACEESHFVLRTHFECVCVRVCVRAGVFWRQNERHPKCMSSCYVTATSLLRRAYFAVTPTQMALEIHEKEMILPLQLSDHC